MSSLRPGIVLLSMVALACAETAGAEKPRKPKPTQHAALYAMHDTHEKEKVTIAAEPSDTKETTPDTRLDYFHHGFLPIRVIVTNDSDVALNLDEARIQFVSAANDVIPAATEDELQRRLFSRKKSETTIPLPAPIPSITIHHKPVDQKILADEQDFGFQSTTVAAHTTASGYLYYDTRSLDEPVLEHAQLEVRRVRAGDKELYSFEIALKPAPEPAKSTTSASGKKN